VAASGTQLLKLECLVCESTGEACVESRFVLPRRAKKIAEIQARLVDLSAEVLDCQVLITGVLHKQIFFVGEDNHVHHVPEDVPFSVFIECPTALAGQEAIVTGQILKLTHSVDFCQEVFQRAVLCFTVRVTEDCLVNAILDPTGPLVKAECVVGDATKAVTIENVVDLDEKAIKIRDIQVVLEDIVAEATTDQVLFQGTLIKSIFFVNEHNIEVFQEEHVDFSGIIDVPCTEPGDNVVLKAQILRVDRFLSNGKQVRQRIVLTVCAKVTRTCELCVKEDVAGPQVLASRVIASNERQILVENVVDLPRPAVKIQEIQARVEDVMVEIIPNKVIITGTLHKQIFFVSDEEIVRHVGEDIPFTTFVDLPGINPSDTVTITPIVEHVGFDLIDAVVEEHCDTSYDLSDPYIGEPTKPLFTRLLQRTVIKLCVIGSQEQPINVASAPLPVDVTPIPVPVC